jgi:2-hydroxy-3-keto-5-methylthiopentenyl-1-phosphate phosphatase
MKQSVGEGSRRRILVLSDFDGTISHVDMGSAVLDRFAPGWKAVDQAYCKGEVGSRIAYGWIAPLFKASREEFLDFVHQREQTDPAFPDFCRFVRGRRMDLVILSDGLDLYIEAILGRYGLEIPFFTNRILFSTGGRVEFVFPCMSEACGRCGTCKRSLLGRFRPFYDRIVYVGDGHSDVCPVQDADLVFAKGILYDQCQKRGIPCRSYRDFGDVQQGLLEEMAAGRLPA